MATKTNPMIQIGDEVREMTAEELADYKLFQQEAQATKQAQADREALKQATLVKLGLTADEVAALLS